MEKYLRQYAEPGTAEADAIPISEPWQRVVVIPVCNESTEILRPLPEAAGRSLLILVVNETETAARHVSLANQDFAAELKTRFSSGWKSGSESGLSLYHDSASPRDVLLVDRFTEGRRFSSKGGVGHARKTGADLATYLIRRGAVLSPWIHCTDADVRLPQGYFSGSAGLDDAITRDTAALVYPFRHLIIADQTSGKLPNKEQQQIMQLTQLYEYSLRYYVAGLSFAGSPYAYHTIGSTMAVNAAHYARVRGFPRRQAGEDFYLLNKLAKVGSIRQLSADTDCEPIDIAVRQSDRVPFGTGAAVGRIMQLADPAREFLLYHPAVFNLLRFWLASLPVFWQSGSADIGAILSQTAVSEPPGEHPGSSSDGLQTLIDGLEKCGTGAALQHAFRQSSDERQFKRQVHTWFDAFRTLKLIHYLRDHHSPSVSFAELLTKLNPDHLMRYESTLPCLHQQLRKDYLNP